jgi:hypothetical protein
VWASRRGGRPCLRAFGALVVGFGPWFGLGCSRLSVVVAFDVSILFERWSTAFQI